MLSKITWDDVVVRCVIARVIMISTRVVAFMKKWKRLVSHERRHNKSIELPYVHDDETSSIRKSDSNKVYIQTMLSICCGHPSTYLFDSGWEMRRTIFKSSSFTINFHTCMLVWIMSMMAVKDFIIAIFLSTGFDFID